MGEALGVSGWSGKHVIHGRRPHGPMYSNPALSWCISRRPTTPAWETLSRQLCKFRETTPIVSCKLPPSRIPSASASCCWALRRDYASLPKNKRNRIAADAIGSGSAASVQCIPSAKSLKSYLASVSLSCALHIPCSHRRRCGSLELCLPLRVCKQLPSTPHQPRISTDHFSSKSSSPTPPK